MNQHRTPKEFMKNLIKLVRVFEWVDKLQLNFIAAFILIAFLPHPEHYLDKILILGFYMIFLGSYGYVVNSYGDREQDAKVGKHPEALFFSERQIKSFLVFFAVPSLVIPLYFPDFKIRILGIATFLLVTFYSIKPARLKERGIFGIFTAALTQRALPFLLFVFLIPLSGISTMVVYFLLVWLSLIGIAVIMTHQFFDLENDAKAGVNTWASKLGKGKVKGWIKIILSLTIVCILIPLFILPLYEGLVISLVTLAFSGYSIGYSVDALRSA